MELKYSLVALVHFVCTALILKGLVRILPSCVLCSFYTLVNISFVIFISCFTFEFVKNRYLNEKVDSRRAVFITGCDSGFGHRLAKRLDSKGYYVFAGCLFPSGTGATSLKESCSKRLKILELDVTKDYSIQQAVEYVKTNLESCELWAVVNNAGVQKGFSLQLTGIDEFKDTLEVNALGPVRVTKAFLPLLKQSKGRVVNVTSLAGRVCMPYVLPYFMSKFAAQGFSDCLRQELDEWGIKVISIEPEMFLTPMTDKKVVKEKLESTIDTMESSVKADCDEKYLRMLKKLPDFVLSLASQRAEIVVDDLESAVTSKFPDSVYKPRRNYFARFLIRIYEIIPNELQDLLSRFVLKFLRHLL